MHTQASSSPSAPAQRDSTSEPPPDSATSIVDTLQSLVIAFVLAFVFRGFVVEAFVIPTGSMAPTLMGTHATSVAPESGYVFPFTWDTDEEGRPLPLSHPRVLPDPMLFNTRQWSDARLGAPPAVLDKSKRPRMGDRILVLKYLYWLFPPQRFDVVVFKNPTEPAVNYIKRLIGLPGETVWLADGDVFTRAAAADEGAPFAIQRKPERVQREVWQPVHHSEYVPLDPAAVGSVWVPPWQGEGWDLTGRHYHHDGTAGPAVLEYRQDVKPTVDYTAYNESIDPGPSSRRIDHYPVSDLRVAAGVEAERDGLNCTIRLEARGHEFEAVLGGTTVVARMRRAGAGEGEWVVLDSQTIEAFAPAGDVVNIEFWHADQALWLFIGDERVAYGEYFWDANTRLAEATGLSGVDAVAQGEGFGNDYVRRQTWPPTDALPRLSWRLEGGGAVTLYRVQVDRDLYYRPEIYPRAPFAGRPALATHPENLPSLDEDQFFVCGDNSAQSLDGRLWTHVDPWVAREIDPTVGVVNRDLMLGKAFFVYFPSPEGVREGSTRFVPNFGEMRFIH